MNTPDVAPETDDKGDQIAGDLEVEVAKTIATEQDPEW